MTACRTNNSGSDNSGSLTDIAWTNPDHVDSSPPDSRGALLQLWSFRCLVQSTLLNRRHQLNGDDLVAVSDQLRRLEEPVDFQPDAIRCTRILKVLRSILKLAHIPQKELQLKKRSNGLLEKLTKQQDHQVNTRNRRQLELRNQIMRHTSRRSSGTIKEHCVRRSKRIAWKTLRRSTRIAEQKGKRAGVQHVYCQT